MEPISGQCNICGWQGEFLLKVQGREGYHCRNCGASSRLRMVMFGLGHLLGYAEQPAYLWPRNKAVRILESSPRGPYPALLADKFDYYGTEFDAEKIRAGTNPRTYADFQNLHYADESFDYVIASDVFEHVRRDLDGFRQVYRVLKKGGTFLLTVPYDHERQGTITRIDTSGVEDVHLMEPEYHGGGGHTITYRNYGRELLATLHEIGFTVGHLRSAVPAHGIPLQSLIVATKAEYVELVGFPGRTDMKSIGPLLSYRLFLLYKYTIKGFVHYWKEVLRR